MGRASGGDQSEFAVNIVEYVKGGNDFEDGIEFDETRSDDWKDGWLDAKDILSK